jgi:hypothetical protein
VRFDVITAMTMKYIICQWVNIVWLHCSTLKIKAKTSVNQHKIFRSDCSKSPRSMSQLCQSQISHSLNLLNECVSTPCNSNSYVYIYIYIYIQNVGQNRDIQIAIRSFENVSQFKFLGTTVTNQNLIQEEIKRRLNSGNACHHSV